MNPSKRAAFDPAVHVQIAADSIAKLRRVDVFRVLESCPKANRAAMVAFILAHREDLGAMVAEVLAEL